MGCWQAGAAAIGAVCWEDGEYGRGGVAPAPSGAPVSPAFPQSRIERTGKSENNTGEVLFPPTLWNKSRT